MRGHLLALVCVCAAMSALAASSSSSLAWRRFKSEHAKVYEPEEDAVRFANFLATKQLVERQNANPKTTFKLGLNHMADWTREEREQRTGNKFRGAKRQERGDSLSPKLAKLLNGPVPEEVDWRKVPNRVTAVKDQGECHAGYAFTATGVLEGQQAVRNMSGLIPLSVQELIDCSRSNDGCIGGDAQLALDDVAFHIIGIESEADYPYEARDNECRSDILKSVMTNGGSLPLHYGNEEELLMAVANYGPVAVSIQTTENFNHYRSGVLDDPYCIPEAFAEQPRHLPPHCQQLLVVGYGTDAKGGDYWILRNSWGTKWGEEGYIRLKRGINMCGIADSAVVAVY